MSLEIERKFLVKNDRFKDFAKSKHKIVQGFISSYPDHLVRVRIMDDKAFLTIKGFPNDTGTTRYEWEKPLEIEEAKSLLEMCLPGIIEKTRYIVLFGNHEFEVDEFHKTNQGLIIAELELENENEHFEKPDWLGKEVTGEMKYFNIELHKNPFMNW